MSSMSPSTTPSTRHLTLPHPPSTAGRPLATNGTSTLPAPLVDSPLSTVSLPLPTEPARAKTCSLLLSLTSPMSTVLPSALSISTPNGMATRMYSTSSIVSTTLLLGTPSVSTIPISPTGLLYVCFSPASQALCKSPSTSTTIMAIA